MLHLGGFHQFAQFAALAQPHANYLAASDLQPVPFDLAAACPPTQRAIRDAYARICDGLPNRDEMVSSHVRNYPPVSANVNPDRNKIQSITFWGSVLPTAADLAQSAPRTPQRSHA